jgi:hypothetical protein
MEIDIFKIKDPVFYNLNQGVFNDCFYFGKVHYIENQPTDAIILSNKQYFIDYNSIKTQKEELIDGKIKKLKVPYGENQIKANGLNYRNSIIESSYFWSNKAIDNFVNDRAEQINKMDLFTEIKTQLEQYMDIEDNRVFDLVTSYILGTYCFTLFNSYGYLFLNCEKNSGKTKLTNLIGFMAFNAINATNPSEASLFRLCESNKPTFLIDDFEKIEDDKQKYINQILKTGYKKGGQTLRIDTNENNRVRMFDLYSPKIINNVGDLEEITLSRCIVIRLLRTKTDKGKIDPIETNPIWQTIRDKCYLFTLQNWKQIKEIYDNYQTDAFNNRNLEISKGILCIAKHISPEIHENVEGYLKESFEDRDFIDYSSNKHYLLFKIMLDKVEQSKEYAVEEIVSWIKEDSDNFGENKKYNYWVGRTLSKIPMFKERRDRTSKKRNYFLSRELIIDYMERQNYPTPESELSEMTYKVFDDEVKVMKNEIMDDCANCKEHKFVKFRSIIVQGRNYCVNCVENDIRKQRGQELLSSMY